ncbi:MAG: toxin-antitoxin system HicB family antitoxin [Lachnospiraceae bacterium]|nr:toxin-antitoxin system HicB family antitoxin [Lachnospiraceae bacterium]
MSNTEKKTTENSGQEKKQILLRLSPSLHNELAAWAEDDFRSINGQIEYLLSEAVKKRKGNKEA